MLVGSKALQPGNKYILQHHSRQIKALVKDVEYKVNVNTLEHEKADGDIKLNEIVKVTLKQHSLWFSIVLEK